MDESNTVDSTTLSQHGRRLKIVTWNVNGIRSFKKGSLKGILDSLNSDIICLQETKVSRDMIDEACAIVEGYSSYFAFCKKRSGYSGVVTYCKDSITPFRAEEGLTGAITPEGSQEIIGNYGDIATKYPKEDLRALDHEGRTVITQHEMMTADGMVPFVIINLYSPRVDPEKPERAAFKENFLKILTIRVDALRKAGLKVIVLGDMNISHRVIDHCDPIPEEEFNKDWCKQWMSSFLDDGPMLDLFRHLHPTTVDAFTCWNTKGNARSTNYGTRIDYIIADMSLGKFTASCEILSQVMGSDHCPVMCVFEVEPISCRKCPSHCSRYFPEFTGKQTKLSHSMFRKRVADDCSTHDFPSNKITKLSDEKNVKFSDEKPLKLEVKKQQASIRNFFTSKTNAAASVNIPVEVSDTNDSPNVDTPVRRDANACASGLWKSLLSGPRAAPLCQGHNEVCVQRTVLKKGPNLNRKFWVCARGEGRANDPKARCNFFVWVPK